MLQLSRANWLAGWVMLSLIVYFVLEKSEIVVGTWSPGAVQTLLYNTASHSGPAI